MPEASIQPLGLLANLGLLASARPLSLDTCAVLCCAVLVLGKNKQPSVAPAVCAVCVQVPPQLPPPTLLLLLHSPFL
jgi:hypothetical protein